MIKQKKHFLAMLMLLAALWMALGLSACTETPGVPSDTAAETIDETSGGTVSVTEPATQTATAPDSDPATEQNSEPETTPATTPTTDPETSFETVPETVAESAFETAFETVSETIPETAPETEPKIETAPLPPEDSTYIYAGETALRGYRAERMSFSYDGEAGFMDYRARADDAWVYLADGIGKGSLIGMRYVQICYATTVAEGQLYIGNEQISDKGLTTLHYENDGGWHIMTVDLFENPCYERTISLLRYDPVSSALRGNVKVAWVAAYPDDGAPAPDHALDRLPALPDDAPADLESYALLSDDFYYRATGQQSGGEGTYVFVDGFRLETYYRAYFNRYTLAYSSTQPLRGEISYLVWDANGKPAACTETFFLEAGENMTFSCLIDGYLDEVYAFGITGVSLETANRTTATFTLSAITSDRAEVYTSGSYYLENDRYFVGVLLAWGGTLSYIEDKLDGDEEIGNLINRYDPGRLIQQSYYGVNDGPYYTAALYNGQKWGYNPVQGGDLYGNASKLVDVRVLEEGKSIYIKCRPLDWAKQNEMTPSYMENIYTLTEDGAIRVWNRFVDFFGVPHPARHAELPAFYTISHLGTFHYYNGTAPWTGGAYETLPDEPFWAGRKEAYHKIVAGNTETWAAWTNPEGYGIGLYVPGVEQMLAGRHEYNGSKDPLNNGTSYVAPLRTMQMVSFVPFEYEYVIAAGSISEMREVFAGYAGKLE